VLFTARGNLIKLACSHGAAATGKETGTREVKEAGMDPWRTGMQEAIKVQECHKDDFG